MRRNALRLVPHLLALAPLVLLGARPLAQRGASVPVIDHAVDRVDVEFQTTFDLPNPRRAVFLTGDVPALGGGDVTRALRMLTDDRLHWRLAVALPPDTSYAYRYVTRRVRTTALSDPTNVVVLTEAVSARTPAFRSEAPGKLFQVRTTFARPVLHWRPVGGEVESFPLVEVGPGRGDGERLFEARGYAPRGTRLELYLTDASQVDGRGIPGAGGALWRDPPAGVYSTPLDEAFLQDGQLFTYVPAARVSRPRRDYDPADPPVWNSAVLKQARPYRVFLPRGYDSHPERRYPVMYVTDGQNVWEGASSWDPDGDDLADLVARGEVGELILVAVDHLGTGCARVRNRFKDMAAPDDVVDLSTLLNSSCTGMVRGRADRFLTFLVTELKPFVDAQYRTLPDREHTFATGFSLGGVYALYAGWDFADWFSAAGSQSGALWIPNFSARVVAEPRRDVRLYFDYGDQELSVIHDSVEAVRDGLLDVDSGFVVERDLRLVVGFGQSHTPRAAGERMESMLTFLWPATRRESELR